MSIHPEDVLRERMLAFEREQYKKKLRPRLPCDAKVIETSVDKTNAKIIDENARQRRAMFRLILSCMEHGAPLNVTQIAKRTCITPQAVSNYTRRMAEEGYLLAIRVPLSDGQGKARTWKYVKSNKKMENDDDE